MDEATRYLEPRDQLRQVIRGLGKLKRGEHESFKDFQLRVDQKRAEVIGHGVDPRSAQRAMMWAILRSGIDPALQDEALDLYVETPDHNTLIVMLSGVHQRAARKKGSAAAVPIKGSAGPGKGAGSWEHEPAYAEQQSRTRRKSTGICWKFSSGHCYRGDKCGFSHGEASAPPRPPAKAPVNNIEVSEDVATVPALGSLSSCVLSIPPLKKAFVLGDETLGISEAVDWELDAGAGMNFMQRAYAEALVAKSVAIRDTEALPLQVLYSSSDSAECSETVAVKLRVRGRDEYSHLWFSIVNRLSQRVLVGNLRCWVTRCQPIMQTPVWSSRNKRRLGSTSCGSR